ncbi:ATP-binding protein [Armatimonas sp.]|uniref:ATP-binding protein n=1 Tax=Armatimonas sp. TaxID=1872638 RepID=UPI003753646E
MTESVLRFFLFSDIEGSTPLWERFPIAMRHTLARHDTIFRETALSQEGIVFKTVGDAFCIVFTNAEAALTTAVAVQRALHNEDWGEIGSLRVRIALHGGEVEERDEDYFGMPLNRVSRMRDAGHGGQILVAEALKQQVRSDLVSWRDMGWHRFRGIEEPEHIFQVVATGLPEDFPTLKSESSHPHNLPSETTSFVGRLADSEKIQGLLVEKKVRLVTITGLGGSGKSRLALHCAGELLWHYPEGIWYVDAIPLARSDEFASTLLHSCGLVEDPKKSPLQQLCEHFRTASALLILDGAERFEELADEIAVLLKGTERLQALVTSRNLLYLSMEHEYSLEPLTLQESVVLFTERAQQARQNFSVAQDEEGILGALCQQLEGNPLAVELAAAQVRSHSLDAICEALAQRLTVLASRMRDLHPRHRSLRATIDWSYQTLSATEKQLFLGLSCFTDGFSIGAAQAVCAEICHVSNVLEVLVNLRDKSLLRIRPGEGERYLLQDSLREYGAQLLESEAPTLARQLCLRHAEHFQQQVADHARELRGPGQKEVLLKLESDAANIRSAQEFFLVSGSLEAAARMVVGLWRFWETRGWLREGRARIQRLLERRTEIGDSLLVAELFLTAGRLEWNGEDASLAVHFLEQCVALCRGKENVSAAQLERTARTVLGMIAYSWGDLHNSDTHYEAALKISLNDPHGEAALKMNLGINALSRGEFPRALPLFDEALVIRQAIGDGVREAQVWNCIGAGAAGLGDLERAKEAFTRSLALYESRRDPIHAAHARINLGDIAVRKGKLQEAQRTYKIALKTLRETEDWRGIIACLLGQAQAALRTEKPDIALPLLRETLALSQRNGYRESLVATLDLVAWLSFQRKHPHRAFEALDVSDTLRKTYGLTRLEFQEQLVGELREMLSNEVPALLSVAETEFFPAKVMGWLSEN